jgi:archaemetzincin
MTKTPRDRLEPSANAAKASSMKALERHNAIDASVDLSELAERVRPLHRKKQAPGPSDWLASHREPGQTFEQYRESSPNRPNHDRNVIYLQPLGTLLPEHERAFAAVAQFLSRFYGLDVKKLEPIALTNVPQRAHRVHPSWGERQILTGYLLEDLLLPRRPRDAVALLGLTPSDLYPGEQWNFVFGQASLDERVGVWSVYRYGDPTAGAEEYRQFLRRTLKVAAHETGHMFGMWHCPFYECAMNGSNHLAEMDARPIDLCPECLKKLWWATGVDPIARFRALAEFSESLGFANDARFFRASLAAVSGRAESQGG